MKFLSVSALVALLLTVVSCGGGCVQAQAQPKTLDEGMVEFYEEDATALLGACRLGHYEHAEELSDEFFGSGIKPEDIDTTQYEIDAYLKLAKIRQLVPAMTRIRTGQASSDGATWVARQLREHSLQPADIGTSWNELRELSSVNVN